MRLHHSIALLFLFLSSVVMAQPCNLQGTYKIGPGGQYPSLTSAIAALMSTGVGGMVILEFKVDYDDSVAPIRSSSGTFPVFRRSTR